MKFKPNPPFMKPDTSHIKEIKVVSNTHWDREFRRTFEKTRRRLLTMMDVTLDILEKDLDYVSYTMDGHSIMIDDYLEMRPERRGLIERLVQSRRLILGPYYTLPEEFSIGQEPLVRNFLRGRSTVEKYGGKVGTVAYTPSSWGQTGQLPQILAEFGQKYMMFYRGVSHDEVDAEWIWEAPDGTRITASRFAIYCRYNWYYQVHRAVTAGAVFEKGYDWDEHDEVAVRIADGLAGEDLAFDLQAPELNYDKSKLKGAILDMIEREGRHFTTPVFLAMHGHDISVAHPLESQIIKDAQELLKGKYTIEHTDLEGFWAAAEKFLDRDKMAVLKGERRSYLKQGMWTFLFPGTVSARTYLKQKDFSATARLVYYAEPLASLAASLGMEYPKAYLERGWGVLMSNHTHDANGGCAPDAVCEEIAGRYAKASDIGDIVTEDAMCHIAKNLSPDGLPKGAMQLIVFNPLPFERDVIVPVDLEVPAHLRAKAARLVSASDRDVARQPISFEKSSSFVDSIWEVPRIVNSDRLKFHAKLSKLPGLGYRTYAIVPEPQSLRSRGSIVTNDTTLENEFLRASVHPNGTVALVCKKTGRAYQGLNYLTSQGECGNAWKHVAPAADRKYSSLGARANVCVKESGPLVGTIGVAYDFEIPADYGDGNGRSEYLTKVSVQVDYCLRQGSERLEVTVRLNNTAKDHWLRANFPSGIETNHSTSDTHFDVISRPIALPDSTGWVEEAFGTHPLQTFVSLDDRKDCLALLPQGLFEYEALEDDSRTLSLTLLRACRIKLAVSEEKLTELPDTGIQCLGEQTFRYSIFAGAGDWRQNALLSLAADANTPVRAIMTSRGHGTLPLESSLFTLDNTVLHVSAVKQAEDGDGLIVRLFNPCETPQEACLAFGRTIQSASRCLMDESVLQPLTPAGNNLPLSIAPKKIFTVRVQL
jgi:mannosylglycerate hydrolase